MGFTTLTVPCQPVHTVAYWLNVKNLTRTILNGLIQKWNTNEEWLFQMLMNASLSWSPTDNMRVWHVCVSCVHTVGLLTCGNIHRGELWVWWHHSPSSHGDSLTKNTFSSSQIIASLSGKDGMGVSLSSPLSAAQAQWLQGVGFNWELHGRDSTLNKHVLCAARWIMNSNNKI